MLTITCPNCKADLEMDAREMGPRMLCPSCRTDISLGAADVKTDVADTASDGPAGKHSNSTASREQMEDLGRQFLGTGAGHARRLLNDLREMDLRKEVLPIDATNFSLLLKDFAFWGVALLGVVPLLIVTVSGANTQLTLFALFFALVWGVIFKLFVLKDETPWKWLMASLFFTGIAGIWLLLFVYNYIFPSVYLGLADSSNEVLSLIGFVFQVGIWEELCKAVPVFIAAFWKRWEFSPTNLVTIGVFSGLGFAAFENVDYGNVAVFQSYSLTQNFGVQGLVEGVQSAMVLVMLRAVSLVFAHAVFSGIFAYFIATAATRGQKKLALILVGLAVSALLHGLYDWFAGLQMTIAAMIIGVTFILFYGYVSKLRSAVSPAQITAGAGRSG